MRSQVTWTQSGWSGCVRTGVIEAMLPQATAQQGSPDNTEAGKSHRDRPHLDRPQPEHNPFRGVRPFDFRRVTSRCGTRISCCFQPPPGLWCVLWGHSWKANARDDFYWLNVSKPLCLPLWLSPESCLVPKLVQLLSLKSSLEFPLNPWPGFGACSIGHMGFGLTHEASRCRVRCSLLICISCTIKVRSSGSLDVSFFFKGRRRVGKVATPLLLGQSWHW